MHTRKRRISSPRRNNSQANKIKQIGDKRNSLFAKGKRQRKKKKKAFKDQKSVTVLWKG
jgi:hypothetical protein